MLTYGATSFKYWPAKNIAKLSLPTICLTVDKYPFCHLLFYALHRRLER